MTNERSYNIIEMILKVILGLVLFIIAMFFLNSTSQYKLSGMLICGAIFLMSRKLITDQLIDKKALIKSKLILHYSQVIILNAITGFMVIYFTNQLAVN